MLFYVQQISRNSNYSVVDLDDAGSFLNYLLIYCLL